jgi:YD repeat-containing protein
MLPVRIAHGAASDVYWTARGPEPRRPWAYGGSPFEALSTSCSYSYKHLLVGKACDVKFVRDDLAVGGCLTYDGRCSANGAEFTPKKTVEIYKKECKTGFFDSKTQKCVVPDAPQPDQGTPMCPSPLQANPIHASTGNKVQQETDFQAHTPFPLKIARTYNSYDQDGLHTSFGKGWRGGYVSRIFTDSANDLYRYHSDGSLHYWYLSGSDFVSDTEPGSSLEKTTEGWTLTDRSGTVRKYDLNGYLVELINPNGLAHGVSYDTKGMISQVTDSFGNALTYDYNTRLLVTAIRTPDGEVYRYDYDDKDNLIAIVYPDETPDDLSDNPQKTYHYEDAHHPHHLTGISNENGNRYATWSYDDSGRAISSEHAEDSSRFTFQYNADGTTEITDPLDNTRTFRFVSPAGLVRIDSVDGGACPNCGRNAKAYEYDDSGLVIQKTDQNGNRVTYVRDAAGRETERVEAAGTQDARTTTTEWHPDFNKPIRITEPDRITEFVYDDKGRLLSKTEQPAP